MKRPREARRRALSGTLAFGVLVASVSSAGAQERRDTWTGAGRFGLGAGLAVVDNRDAVGETQGTAVAFAVRFDAGWKGRHGPHVLALGLTSRQGLTFSTVASTLTKMVDDLGVGATYELLLSKWIRPFGEIGAHAPLFATDERQPAGTTFAITHPDGTVERRRGSDIDLAGPVRPLSIRESVGARFRPVAWRALTLRLDGGLGAAHIVADGARALADDPRTASIEVVETQTSHGFGPEAALGVAGRIDGDRLTYDLDARARIPVASSNVRVAQHLGAAARIDLEVRGDVSLSFVPWLSLDYALVMLRRPLLTERLELSNTLMLSVRPTANGVTL